MIFVSVCLTSLRMSISRSIQVAQTRNRLTDMETNLQLPEGKGCREREIRKLGLPYAHCYI